MTCSIVRWASVCLPLFLCLSVSACGDSSSGEAASAGGCAWLGNCSTSAPEGAYDCSGNTLVQCLDSTWEEVAYCPGFVQGARSCTCKGGCGVDTTECSYAFETCGGQRYETCGPNATAELNDKWECVPDA
jgi:hypothetical protein